MLQIRKTAIVKACKINLQFLLKRKPSSNLVKDEKTFTKKTKSTSVTLRSPKHFNISKHKIISLNYKTPCMTMPINKFIFLPNLNKLQIYNIIKKTIRVSLTTTIKSCKLYIKTKFKVLMWRVELLYC